MPANTHFQEHEARPASQDKFWLTVTVYGGEHHVQSRQYIDLLESVDVFRSKVGSQKYSKVKLCLHYENKVLVLSDHVMKSEGSSDRGL